MRGLIVVVTTIQMTLGQLVLAQEQYSGPIRQLELPELATLSSEEETRVQGLIIKHKGGSERPEACPLESNEQIDILTKITNIKALFKDNCLDTDQNRLDELLAGATSIQEEINNAQSAANSAGEGSGSGDATATTPTDTTAATLDIGGASLSGQEIANVVSNINQIYKDRSCSILNNNDSFLEKAAGFISDFAKIGLLVPNTYALAVAGGGIALSSILLILNSLFERRFNFEDTNDRQSFIKLNCAFYDIRRDIEKSGFLDVPTDAHRADKDKVADYVKLLEAKVEELNKSKEAIDKILEDDKKAYLEEKMGVLLPLGEVVAKAREVVLKPLTTLTDKLAMIRSLTLLYPELSTHLQQFIDLGLGEIPLLDTMLMQELRKLDHVGNSEEYRELIGMTLANFKDAYIAGLLFHFNRVDEVSAQQREKYISEWSKAVRVGDLDLEAYGKQLAEDFAKKQTSWSKLYADLGNVNTRLKRILDSDDFSSGDDGSENIVTILGDYDKIVEQIYGKFGEKFLEYTTKKSQKENKKFAYKFREFARDHLIHQNGDGHERVVIPSAEEMGRLRILYACQDAKPFRRMWKYSESLAQQGYDFVSTNADLFHSDIRRLFLGRSDGRIGIHNFLSKFEKIQHHHKSAIYAQDVLAGRDVSDRNKKKYLKKKFLGRAMLEIEATKPYASLLQEVIEAYDCTKATQMQ